MSRVHRVDVGNRIRVDHRTPQGHAKIPARLARTGVQSYPQADGTVRREYRPADEVFAAKSIATFDTATVVEGHPDVIGPANWKEHARGDIRNAARDGIYVAADIVVRDADTLAKIERGDLCELSCGYDCTLEMKPGTSPDGEKYDAVQRDITINHVGMGPANWGRAGSEVRLRLDGGGVAYADERDDGRRPRDMTPEEIKALQDKAARADMLEAQLASQTAATAAAEKARADAAEGKLDEALARAKRLEEQVDPKRVDAIVTARMAVLDGARVLHGKQVAAGGTDREIMVAAIQARDPEFKADGRSDDYVRARFDVKVEDAKRAGASLADVNAFTSPTHLDASGTSDGLNDREFETLCKRFDASQEYLEDFAAADPWKVGALSAGNAASKSLNAKIGA